jgi:class 3 adenylate cyclase/tetratricopeptide (TPR) repeat protein
VPICTQCGEDAGPRARFCPACGAPFPASAPERETRKIVTVLFSDVTGSTALGERLDPESMRRVMARYFDQMRAALEAHGGTVEKFIGDAVMAVFGVPVVHEDDALRALRAAVEMQERLARLNDELERDFGVRLESRTGVNTGEVVVGDGRSLATGDAVNVAARLEQAAAPGEILVGAATRALAREAAVLEAVEPLELKGKSGAVAAWRLVSVSAETARTARRLDVPIVGRERELRLLREAFERAAGERSCHLFTVLGPAGVGKSRLIAELLAGLGDHGQVLRGRCLPYGDGITYWPLAGVVRQAAGISDDLSQDEARTRIAALLSHESDAALVAERVGSAIGLAGAAGAPEEVFWAARKLLESLAGERPLVLVFDDIHWAEPTFLDLIEHVAEWSRDAPILLVAMARPDLLELRPGWAGGKLNATSILLESLTDEESERLIDELLGPPKLAPTFRRRIVETAGGNPLFVEEMLAMLLDLEGETVEVPPTIQALLAARLDQLPTAERDALERASVVGQEFSRASLVELGGDAAQLGPLVRKELVRPVRSAFAGDDSFRFRHLLIRDAAYASLSKEARADLHERFGRWLERSTGDRIQEYEEIVGYHLEQAHRYHAELGPLDERGRRLAAEAAERLGAAGLRALDRTDARAARGLLERALELEPADARLELALAAALFDIGEFEVANVRLEALAAGDDPVARLRARLFLDQLSSNRDPDADLPAAAARARSAIAELEGLDDVDPEALADAWLGIMRWNLMCCRYDAMREAAEQVLKYARLAGNKRLESEAFFWMRGADHFGPTPVSVGLARPEPPTNGPFDDASELLRLGALHGMRGEFEEGRRLNDRARSIYLELGLPVWYHGTALMSGMLEELAGDLQAAERIYRDSCAGLRSVGETGYLSTHAGALARVLCLLGRFDEAEEFLELAVRTTNPADQASVMLMHTVRGLLLTHAGDFAEAEREAREALSVAERTDGTEWHGNVLMDLASVLEAAGRPAEAAAAVESALALYEQKELAPMVARARERLGALAV